MLKASGIDIALGVGAEEARTLNEAFIKHICTGRPYVIAKCAATLDGRIATRTGDSKWITGESARRFVHELRHAVDAILVGSGTIAADDPLLTARLDDRPSKDPLRVILDTYLRISPSARALTHRSSADTMVVSRRRCLRSSQRPHHPQRGAGDRSRDPRRANRPIAVDGSSGFDGRHQRSD